MLGRFGQWTLGVEMWALNVDIWTLQTGHTIQSMACAVHWVDLHMMTGNGVWYNWILDVYLFGYILPKCAVWGTLSLPLLHTVQAGFNTECALMFRFGHTSKSSRTISGETWTMGEEIWTHVDYG